MRARRLNAGKSGPGKAPSVPGVPGEFLASRQLDITACMTRVCRRSAFRISAYYMMMLSDFGFGVEGSREQHYAFSVGVCNRISRTGDERLNLVKFAYLVVRELALKSIFESIRFPGNRINIAKNGKIHNF